MIFAYIGGGIAALLLVGLASLAVLWMAKTVGKSIRHRTVELFSAYDEILSDRSRELAQIESDHQINEKKAEPAAEKARTGSEAPAAPTSAMSVVSRISSSPYRDAGTGSLYQKIRSGFCFSAEEAVKKLPTEVKENGEGPASELLHSLTCETVCAMASLPQEQQYELLHTNLEGSQRELVESYAQTHKSFDTISFYDYLRQAAAVEPKAPVLRMAPSGQNPETVGGVEVITDPTICEGFELEAGNRIYDYSIKVREIC